MWASRHIWMLFSSMMALSQANKAIFLTNVQCHVKSSIISKIACDLRTVNSFDIDVTTKEVEIKTVVGLSKLNLFTYGRTNIMHLNGIRLDICNLLRERQKFSLLSMLYAGIWQTDNNLPNKCPFKKNTTYRLHGMKFDANYLPGYLPEYNFSFIGLFHANKVNTFEVWVNGSFCDENHNCSTHKN